MLAKDRAKKTLLLIDQRIILLYNNYIFYFLYILSGFLISFAILRKLSHSGGRFNYMQFIFQNWLRFTILGFGSILFSYLFEFFGEGPVWHYGIKYATNGCKNPWNLIKILLFINNFQSDSFQDNVSFVL